MNIGLISLICMLQTILPWLSCTFHRLDRATPYDGVSQSCECARSFDAGSGAAFGLCEFSQAVLEEFQTSLGLCFVQGQQVLNGPLRSRSYSNGPDLRKSCFCSQFLPLTGRCWILFHVNQILSENCTLCSWKHYMLFFQMLRTILSGHITVLWDNCVVHFLESRYFPYEKTFRM